MAEYRPDSPQSLLQTHKGSNPRLTFFYLPIVVGLLVLGGGMIYQQALHSETALEKEQVQSQLRIIVPGPRGNLYDREGRILVGNRPRFSAVLSLDELRTETVPEYKRIRRNYAELDDVNLPSIDQMSDIARYTVVNRYLQRINTALGRDATLDAKKLRTHYRNQRLLPFTLIDDLAPEEYARLLEQLPVNSPLQVYTTSARSYPYGTAAAHVLGYVGSNRDVEIDEAFPGANLVTFPMIGAEGRDGLELEFDDKLQGEAGGTIYRVDPHGYRVESLVRRLPVQGENITTSIDIDLQLAAETRLREYDMASAAVAIDVNTGEVLAMASMPDYDLNNFSPRLSQTDANDINERGAWINRATQGLYPPGSSFKILITLAGMRAGAITPESDINCNGYYRVGNRLFPCHGGHAHGEIVLHTAIAKSCNVFFYKYGLETGADAIANEARRFGFGSRTGIELPNEATLSLIPDPQWKKQTRGQNWVPGDTANMSIGQGDVLVTPLQMATFIASVARGQTRTTPYLLHDPNRPTQHTDPIGLSAANYAALLDGMEECVISGTARAAFSARARMDIPGLRVAGKTGTAQKRTSKGTINFAWFIGFAPIERPQIAIAVMVEGDTPDEETGGGTFSAPVAHDILKKWVEKHPELLLTPPAAPAPAKPVKP